jgi:hypothetical protein
MVLRSPNHPKIKLNGKPVVQGFDQLHNRTNMSIPTTGSLVDLLHLSTLLPKKPPRAARKGRRPRHYWTDEELNLISYLRLQRNWSGARSKGHSFH